MAEDEKDLGGGFVGFINTGVCASCCFSRRIRGGLRCLRYPPKYGEPSLGLGMEYPSVGADTPACGEFKRSTN